MKQLNNSIMLTALLSVFMLEGCNIGIDNNDTVVQESDDFAYENDSSLYEEEEAADNVIFFEDVSHEEKSISSAVNDSKYKDCNWRYATTDLNSDENPDYFVEIIMGKAEYGEGCHGDIWYVSENAKPAKLEESIDFPEELQCASISETESAIIINYNTSYNTEDGHVYYLKNNKIESQILPVGRKEFDRQGNLLLWQECKGDTCKIIDGKEVWSDVVSLPYSYHFENGSYKKYSMKETSLNEALDMASFDKEDLNGYEAYQFFYREDGCLIINASIKKTVLEDMENEFVDYSENRELYDKEPDNTIFYKTFFFNLNDNSTKWVLNQTFDGYYEM